MRSNGVLASRENAARMGQVRASIGRQLREHYDAAPPALPDSRLADLLTKIEQSEGERLTRDRCEP